MPCRGPAVNAFVRTPAPAGAVDAVRRTGDIQRAAVCAASLTRSESRMIPLLRNRNGNALNPLSHGSRGPGRRLP
jgi:hypothetical protein